jgi:hypothetical protein
MNRLKLWWLTLRLHASYRRWDRAYWRWYRGFNHELDAATTHLTEMHRRHEKAKEEA